MRWAWWIFYRTLGCSQMAIGSILRPTPYKYREVSLFHVYTYTHTYREVWIERGSKLLDMVNFFSLFLALCLALYLDLYPQIHTHITSYFWSFIAGGGGESKKLHSFLSVVPPSRAFPWLAFIYSFAFPLLPSSVAQNIHDFPNSLEASCLVFPWDRPTRSTPPQIRILGSPNQGDGNQLMRYSSAANDVETWSGRTFIVWLSTIRTWDTQLPCRHHHVIGLLWWGGCQHD